MSAESFFARLVSLREEDFLTRLLEYLFNTESTFRSNYLKRLGFSKARRFRAEAQRPYGISNEDKPDLTIKGPHTLIFQENKIDSPEGRNQLRRYAKRLASRTTKRKFLVYLARNPPRDAKPISNIKVQPLSWHEVAGIARKTAGTSWVMGEFYKFLEEYDMAPPIGINPGRLKRSWKHFEPERQSIVHMLKDTEAKIGSTLDANKYRCRFSDEQDGIGIYVYRNQGKLKKQLADGYIWLWGGIALDDDEVNAYVGIGWVRSKSEIIPDKVRPFLCKHHFQPYDDRYEEYYAEQALDRIIGSAKSYDAQHGRLSTWLITRIQVALKALKMIEVG